MKIAACLGPAVLFFMLFAVTETTCAQTEAHRLLRPDGNPLKVDGIVDHSGVVTELGQPYPLVSFVAWRKNEPEAKLRFISGTPQPALAGENWFELEAEWDEDYRPGISGRITFRNVSADTIWLTNVVPFGQSDGYVGPPYRHIFLTGLGDHPLSRANLFIPGSAPVSVILPDNAWELGFSALATAEGSGVCALVRRDPESLKMASRRRFETEIRPGGSVSYRFWADLFSGPWQEGLRLMFQERMLYDVEPGTFDNSLYAREDLHWIRHTYASHLIMAWDAIYYDYVSDRFGLPDFEKQAIELFGGNDFIGLWPTWPTLGVDQRNQWDLFRDLPGGMEMIRQVTTELKGLGTELFICYNPWDESTRTEGHAAGMADIIRETGAGGVVLDTMGESSKELQLAADNVRPGIVMYSEGMATPRNMQGIVSGRVHNALYYPPMLNLNKFIKPEFTIYRVAELYKEPIRREYNLAFFNGYGTEMNIFAPGKPAWAEEQYRHWGRTLRLLRENTHQFLSAEMLPLVPTTHDRIWVNKWPLGEKTIYTLFSLAPEGYDGLLFEVHPEPGYHYADLWNNTEVEPEYAEGRWMLPVRTAPFPASDLGSNNESQPGCIAKLPRILDIGLKSDQLSLAADRGEVIRVWAGDPAYGRQALELPAGRHELFLLDHFGRYEGKFVVQLLEGGSLLDQRVFEILPGTARLMSRVEKTEPARECPEGMAEIPAGSFVFKASHGDNFIPYPTDNIGDTIHMPSFFMDIYPVTNLSFKLFLDESGYIPSDSLNFLAHWTAGEIPGGEEHHPVVYVSWEDALAYALWANKRLPTELEWQYAAQTPDMREWPWEQQEAVTRSPNRVTATLTVYEIEGIAPGRTNTGDGILYPAGSFPDGANPYGLHDLVGSVWQLTNDIYFSGSYRSIIMKGGSYFKPSASWWYVQGGPRELHYRQQLLRVSQGFERNATVGFRCVKDK
jgi:gamma-glutamyl hercynylcysteine S-oxide synthase